MALEIKLGQDLRLRQQLVMTPQLQQAIKILQLSLPELESVVQAELEQNPMLEPLDRSPAETAAESEMPEPGDAGEERADEPLPAENSAAAEYAVSDDDNWKNNGASEAAAAPAAAETEARDASAELK
ncbi:MAG: RNA polymerase factor sigma-54, partial [Candidatus Binataceae bacterium]